MAVGKNRSYLRNASDQLKFSYEKVCMQEIAKATISSAAPLAAAVLPAGQSFTTPDVYAETIICGGTVKKIGSIYGVLCADTKVGDIGAYATQGVIVKLLQAALQTMVAGASVFIKDADGLAYDAGGAGFVEVGYAVTEDGNAGFEETNPDNMPAGDYVFCLLHPVI